jgi:hypothetical protein
MKNVYKILFSMALMLFLSITSYANDIQVDLYPNPTSGELYIRLDEAQAQGEIIVFNFIGEQVYKQNLEPNQFDYELDLYELPKGSYFIKIIYENGNSTTKKFSKSQ